jgi:hypothetical protein
MNPTTRNFIIIGALIVALIACINWAAAAYGFDIVGKVLPNVDEKRVATGLTLIHKIVYTVIAAIGAIGVVMAIFNLNSA